MKVSDAATYIREGLHELYDEAESANIAQLVVEACTGLSRMDLLVNKNLQFPPTEEEKLRRCLHRLQRHEPVQYVLQQAWFYNLPLYVDKNVLIPRPETEELVDWIITDVKAAGQTVFERSPQQADATTELKILDMGTGSGCIALALKKAMPRAEVWGCDVSEEALNVARRNGAALDIRVDFQGVNFLDSTQHTFLPTVDILVSNPPYIPLRDKEAMHPNVVQFEPHRALFVPDDDALVFYKAIAAFATKRLYQNGAIYLEIHEELGAAVAALFRAEGYEEITIRKDMQGKERMVKVSLNRQ